MKQKFKNKIIQKTNKTKRRFFEKIIKIEFSDAAGYMINIRKSTVYLYTSYE